MPSITHIVIVKFKPSTPSEKVLEVYNSFLSLEEKCVSANTNTPYMKSIVGGRDISIEGKQKGLTHAFIAEFLDERDRDYYVREDPAHRAFTQVAGEVLEDIVVVDFKAGDMGT